MGKSSRTKARAVAATASATGSTGSTGSTGGEVGPRQPCPCGSGKRYKACHGAPGGADVYVARPFAGLASECDWIALRELVPAATAPLTLRDASASSPEVVLCTLLPGAAPGLVRESGQVWLGMQVQHAYGDASRELAAVLSSALAAAAAGEPGVVGLPSAPGPGPRLQDLLVDAPLEVSVHEGFGFWTGDLDDAEVAGDLAEALETASGQVAPTARLASVEAAYWTDVSTKEHLRWVLPEPEDALLDALSRLHAAGEDVLVPDARLIGMFRADGVLAPVWDLPLGTGAAAVEEPAAAFRAKLDTALAATEPLTAEERSTRAGLATRQVTIR